MVARTEAVKVAALSIDELLSKGYFPKELPPAFTTSSLGHFVTSVGVSNLPQPTKSVTLPLAHNLSRSGPYRRVLQVPNPANHIRLCDVIAREWATFEAHYSKSTFSLSTPVLDPISERALVTKTDGSELDILRARHRSTSLFLLRTDISRYYATIYTHSIPWALITRPIAKARRNDRNLLGNVLDKLVRDAQDQQTIGIPIGPDTSLAMAEVIGCEIDSMLQLQGLSGIRYMDDIELAFDSRSEAEEALSKIEETLSQFELAINPRKTSIEELPTQISTHWVTELKDKVALPWFQINDNAAVLRYFDRAFSLRSRFPGEPVLTYALARLEGVNVASKAWDAFQDFVCQCVTVEPLAMRSAIAVLQAASKALSTPVSEGLDRVIHKMIQRHGGVAQGSDVAWALWAAIVFSRRIPNQLAAQLDGKADTIVALIALHARALGIIHSSVQFPGWESTLNSDDLYGREWLLAYEASTKGWLTSPKSSMFVDNDPFFGQLKRNGVSFYDATAHTRQVVPTRGKPNY